jgi:hypothetical protein
VIVKRGVVAFVIASTPFVCALADEKPNARLSWVRMPGAESCVDGEALKKSVTARLGRDPFAGNVAIEIEGTIAREPKRWIAKLWLRDDKGAPAGSRELTSEADTCASLGEAVALAIALAIDPDAGSSPAVASASASVSTSAPPVRVAIPKPSATPTPPAPPSASITTAPPPSPPAVFARALLSTSLLPKPAPGIGIAFEPVFDHSWRATFGAAYLFPQKTTDGIVAIGMTTLHGGLCGGSSGNARIGADLCLALHGGVTHATAHRLEPDQPGDRVWFGATAGVRFRINLSGFVIEALVDAMVPITRHRFRITGMAEDDALFSQSPGLLAGFGLGWSRF